MVHASFDWRLLIISSACFVVFIPTNITNVYLTKIAYFYNFDEHERDKYIGAGLQAVSMIGQVFATLVAGQVTGYGVNRARMVVFILLLSSLNTILLINSTFQTLFIVRLFSGLAQGAVVPVAFAMAADLFQPADRPGASAVLSGAIGGGILSGQLFGGYMDGVLNWNIQMGLMGALSILLVSFTSLVLKDPSPHGREHDKGAFDRETAVVSVEHDSSMCCSRQTCKTLSIPSVALLLLQSVPGTIPWGALFTFLPDFLTNEAGLRMDYATTLIAFFGVGGSIGGGLGGLVGNRLYMRRSKRLFCLSNAAMTLMGAVLTQWVLKHGLQHLVESPSTSSTAPEGMSIVVSELQGVLEENIPDTAAILSTHPTINAMRNFAYACFGAVLCGACASFNGANLKAMLLNLSPQVERARVISLANVLTCVGRGIGPVFAKYYVSHTGAPRVEALVMSVNMWYVSGVLLTMTAFTMDKDIIEVMSFHKGRWPEKFKVKNSEDNSVMDELA